MTARRTDHMEYMDGMEALDSDILDKVIHAMDHYDPNTPFKDVLHTQQGE